MAKPVFTRTELLFQQQSGSRDPGLGHRREADGTGEVIPVFIALCLAVRAWLTAVGTIRPLNRSLA